MDKVMNSFLKRQSVDAQRINLQSDLVKVVPYEELSNEQPPEAYLVSFCCMGLVKTPGGEVVVGTDPFVVGIRFPSDYLRHVNPLEIVCWLGPFNVFHPNIRPPGVCIGKIKPGTELIAIIHQLFDMITYANFATDDAFNEDSAEWARNNFHRFPLDRRPLKSKLENQKPITVSGESKP